LVYNARMDLSTESTFADPRGPIFSTSAPAAVTPDGVEATGFVPVRREPKGAGWEALWVGTAGTGTVSL